MNLELLQLLLNIILVITAAYIICIAAFTLGLYNLKERFDDFDTSLIVRVSVIIAARNEELNIKELLQSLYNQTFPKKLYEVIAELKKLEDVQDVLIDNDIALVAIVGRNMATKVGMSAKLFSILGKNNINIKVIAQASQELSIIVGVQNSQFENAIKAIYDNLV